MQFAVLGPLEVRRADGSPVSLGGPKVQALLSALLRDPGSVVGFERLVDAVYGARPPAGADNALQSQVSRLRQALGSPQLVERYASGYRLAVDPAQVDAHRFEALLTRARTESDPVESLREALDLWRGPAPELPRLEELRVECVERLAAAHVAGGAPDRALPLLRALVDEHPLRDRPRALLVTALHGAGRAAEALLEFDAARRRLAEELGADPGPELATAHAAALQAPAPPPRRLPLQLTSFVGRESELDRVTELLTRHRLVTLTGPGGAGKTRIATRAAGRHSGDVVFVELAPLDVDDELTLAVLDALDAREATMLGPRTARRDRSAVERLVAALADRPMLLVLDNCEHVIDAAAQLAHRLLSSCRGLRILATSREALRIAGEGVCPVPSLSWPPPGELPERPLDFPAIHLFAERAAAVRPGFAVTPSNVAAVTSICRALDGLPLAIELAAARVNALAVDEIAARLAEPDDRFALLSRGSRAAASRHRTLAAVVEWSWRLLDDAERSFAARFTCFAGGATLDAAVRVCGPADALASLVDKSLIEVGGDGRYRMLQTIKAFCAQQLGDAEAAARAHAQYFLELARTADPWLRTAEQLDWLQVLKGEHDNLAAALRWAVRADPDVALHLHSALAQYWWLAGRKSEGAASAAQLLERLPPEPPPDLRQEYLVCICSAAVGRVDGTELREQLALATEIARSLTDPPRQPFVMLLWGAARGLPREEEIADQLLVRSHLVAESPWTAALAHLGSGLLAMYRADLEPARALLTESVAGFRALGDRWATALVLSELALLSEWLGDSAVAAALTEEALQLAEQIGATEEMAEQLCRRGDMRLRAGDHGAALADYERAAEIAGRTGSPDMRAAAGAGMGDVARLAGRFDEARERFHAALAECPTRLFGSAEIRCRCLVGLGRIEEALGDGGAAERWHREAIDSAVAATNFHAVAVAVEAIAGVALLAGDPERAALLIGVGQAIRGSSIPADPDIARTAHRSVELLGPDGYARAHARGAAMSRAEILTDLELDPSAIGA